MAPITAVRYDLNGGLPTCIWFIIYQEYMVIVYCYVFFVNLIWFLYLFWLNKHCLSLSKSESVSSLPWRMSWGPHTAVTCQTVHSHLWLLTSRGHVQHLVVFGLTECIDRQRLAAQNFLLTIIIQKVTLLHLTAAWYSYDVTLKPVSCVSRINTLRINMAHILQIFRNTLMYVKEAKFDRL